MKIKSFLLFALLIPFILSCKQVREKTREGGELVKENTDKLKRRALDKTAWAIDKVIPHFDEKTPDTQHNKERFKEFFGFYPTADVKNLYCYGDMLGIDAKFQFAFSCDSITTNRIIKNKSLVKQADSLKNQSPVIFDKFNWWETEKLDSITPYWYNQENQYFIYLWYDSLAKKAYYLDFDM